MAKKASRKRSSKKSTRAPKKQSAKRSSAPKKVSRSRTTTGHVEMHAHPKVHVGHSAAHELGALVIRLALGIVFLAHGAMKLFVAGAPQVGQYFGSLGIPAAGLFGWLVTLLEFGGGILLILGLFTRWTALLLAIDMFFAWLLVHAGNGFFISQEAAGFELVFLLMLVCLAVFFHGAGHFSLEKAIFGREL